jgi:hypothetical protein
MSAVPTADRWARRDATDDSGRLTREGWCTELALFLLAYLAYVLARWLFAGDLEEAREHAGWIHGLEQSAHIAVEGSVQRAFDSPGASWLLSNVYLAAQLVVVPGTLIWLYRRSPGIYRETGSRGPSRAPGGTRPASHSWASRSSEWSCLPSPPDDAAQL